MPWRWTSTGSERSGTRWANSTITVNLVEFDRQLTITVRIGQKTASVTTRDFSDAALQASVDERSPTQGAARLPEPARAARRTDLHSGRRGVAVRRELRPRERALMVKESIDICEKRGVLGAGYIPKMYQTNCTANTKGLFALLPVRRSGLHPHVPNGGRQRDRAGPASRASRTSR